MDIQDMGAVGDIISAIAVVLSLVYLAIQIRQSTQTIRLNTFHEVVRDQASTISLLSTDAELSRINYKGLSDFHSLTKVEQGRWECWYLAWLRLFENLLAEIENERIDPDAWVGIVAHNKLVMSQPGFAQWWNGHQRYRLFSRRLQDFVNKEILLES